MGTYGRNGDFRQSPLPQHRLGRFTTGDDPIPQFAPVIGTGDADANGRRAIELAAEDADRPLPGQGGIALYEQADAQYRGQDPTITRPSDMVDCPANTPTQVCHGTEVRIALFNTEEDDFRGMRPGALAYPARVMVDGASGATPTVDVDDLLGVGAGNDTDGYWKVVTDPDTAWAVVVEVDSEIGLVVAQMLF